MIGSATRLCRSLARTRAISTYRQASPRLAATTNSRTTTMIPTTPHRLRRSLPCHEASRTFASSTPVHRADAREDIAAAGQISPILEQDPTVHSSFDKVTGSWQYVVADPATSIAAIIDPVLDFDPLTGKISTESADALMRVVDDNGYKVDLILETHAHADHITAASYLQHRLSRGRGHRARICIGSRITQVQKMFGERYSIPAQDYEDSFDKLWQDDESFKIGNLTAKAIHLPGHTPDHLGYKIGGNVFVGDSVFNIDLGSARADFPGGSAESIFDSGRRLFALPDDTKLWIGHDYPPEGRDGPVAFTTVKQQKETNKHLRDGTAKQQFMEMRRSRDSTLASPRLLHQSLQMNIRAGRLPKPTAAGERMLQIPLETEVAW